MCCVSSDLAILHPPIDKHATQCSAPSHVENCRVTGSRAPFTPAACSIVVPLAAYSRRTGTLHATPPYSGIVRFTHNLLEGFCKTLSIFYHALQGSYDDTTPSPVKFRHLVNFHGFKRHQAARQRPSLGHWCRPVL
jgi:hypothetical protein